MNSGYWLLDPEDMYRRPICVAGCNFVQLWRIVDGLRNIADLGVKLWNDNVYIFSDARYINHLTYHTCIEDHSALLIDVRDFV